MSEFEEFNKTCSGPGGGFSEQGSERQRVIRSSWRRRRESRVVGEEGSRRQDIVMKWERKVREGGEK